MTAKLPAPDEHREPVSVNGTVFRHCLRSASVGHVVRHAFDYADCDCLRRELPVDAQAKSSGALGTPDRNHTCPDCRGLGEVSIYPCQRCLGAGELNAAGIPALKPPTRKDWREFAAVRVLSDAVMRRKVSKARSAGKLGVRS